MNEDEKKVIATLWAKYTALPTVDKEQDGKGDEKD